MIRGTDNMKGIVLAGGLGTRLHPLTSSFSKQLLPIYDKPMIYYPISALMLAGIREILIICTPFDLPIFQRMLGNGSRFGIEFTYITQPTPDGLAQAFILGERFIGTDCVCLVLGDNIFYGQGFSDLLIKSASLQNGAIVYAYNVSSPEQYGVAEFDVNNNILSIEEKPRQPKSNYAITGIYFYDNRVVDIAKSVAPSPRGELEISSINNIYIQDKSLAVEKLGRGFAWLDTGTHETMLEASQFVQTLEKRQGFKIACLEEIAWRNNWIDEADLQKQISTYPKNDYSKYLKMILDEKNY
jgi:glucose-1-phosphate thymidylyltransferase